MFSHVFLGVQDFERALSFYEPLMALLGLERRFCDRTRPWAGWHSAGGGRPLLLIGKPWDDQDHVAGNGQMVALLAADRATVRSAWTLALAQGARDEGAPGLRPQYHPYYYGAYFRDTEGNKLCVVCHAREDD